MHCEVIVMGKTPLTTTSFILECLTLTLPREFLWRGVHLWASTPLSGSFTVVTSDFVKYIVWIYFSQSIRTPVLLNLLWVQAE